MATQDHSSNAGLPLAALHLLACPACHHGLQPADSAIVCSGCGLRYPVRDGIPVLIVDEAQDEAQAPPSR